GRHSLHHLFRVNRSAVSALRLVRRCEAAPARFVVVELLVDIATGGNGTMKQTVKTNTRLAWIVLLAFAGTMFAGGQTGPPQNPSVSGGPIQGKEAYVMRDGLRSYLWEKYKEGNEGSFSRTGNVALLVHGGTWSGRPDFDLQIRDYSLMDFLAQHDFDVWAINIHGYGHSDKTDKDWSDVHSAAADIAAAVEYITKLRSVRKVDLLGWSAGTQRAGLFVMQHPDRVAKLI